MRPVETPFVMSVSWDERETKCRKINLHVVNYSLVNCTLIYPDNIEEKIDFGVIRNELHHRCTSPLGREQVDAMKFLTDYETITGLLSETDEMKHIMEDGSLDFPRGEMYDVREALRRIRIEGLFLDEAELFALRKTLDYAHQLEQFFVSLDDQRFPILHQLPVQNTSADGIGDIVRSIDRVIDKYGRLADNASPELSRIRHELTIVQGSVGRALGQILRQAQAEGILDKDVTPTLREGRWLFPFRRPTSGKSAVLSTTSRQRERRSMWNRNKWWKQITIFVS